MQKNNISWLFNLKSKLPEFIESMQEDNYSYFKYSMSGDIYSKCDNWGLANLVYAVKIMYSIGMLPTLSIEQKNNLYRSIIKFSDINGYIYDPIITGNVNGMSIKKILKSIIGLRTIKKDLIDIQRAETKQAFATLYILDKKPLKHFSNIPKSREQIDSYLSKFNWSYPWHACAHFAILIFFLSYNKKFFDISSAHLIQYAIDWLNGMQSSVDGAWYTGRNISLQEKINGAMKYLTGIHAADIYDFPYPKKLVDTALSAVNDGHACDNLNIVYILYSANKIIPEYRKSDIEKFLLDRLNIYHQYFYHERNAFSFKIRQANNYLYGCRVSKGKNEPDIHGTLLFLLGIAMVDKVLQLDLGLQIPVF